LPRPGTKRPLLHEKGDQRPPVHTSPCSRGDAGKNTSSKCIPHPIAASQRADLADDGCGARGVPSTRGNAVATALDSGHGFGVTVLAKGRKGHLILPTTWVHLWSASQVSPHSASGRLGQEGCGGIVVYCTGGYDAGRFFSKKADDVERQLLMYKRSNRSGKGDVNGRGGGHGVIAGAAIAGALALSNASRGIMSHTETEAVCRPLRVAQGDVYRCDRRERQARLARQRAFDARGHRQGIEEACASR